ncbi:YegP family protein [Spongiimicrobium sp. 3-5]|uniref:YegP family protein n=1 Tax=Spongiimicrobium sp. 3-5 TaxID=3332596 RepID=UPI0039816C48
MIQIKKEKTNSFSFSLKTEGGITLLKSVEFHSEEAIKKTITSLYPLVKNNNAFERRTNSSGEFLFNLKDGNGRIIGNSQLYNSEAGMENGIKNLRNRITSLPPNLDLGLV